jgi:NTE family protein
MTPSKPRKTFALALGSGGARGIAHIPVIEALDELGLRPTAIAGSSIGALIGAAYAAGMTGKEIRRHVIAFAHDRAQAFRGLVAARSGAFGRLFAAGGATLVDAEKFCEQFLPAPLPESFEALPIPLTVIASDLHRRKQVALSSGPLRPALAASISLPGLMRPVAIDDMVLVDGGATNPLPFDALRGRADIVVAVDISGEPSESRRDIPSPFECIASTVLVMGNAIMSEKLKHSAPDLMVRPNVGVFRTLDFFQASAILRAAEPARAEIATELQALLEAP